MINPKNEYFYNKTINLMNYEKIYYIFYYGIRFD
jgi:hypothetical protein